MASITIHGITKKEVVDIVNSLKVPVEIHTGIPRSSALIKSRQRSRQIFVLNYLLQLTLKCNLKKVSRNRLYLYCRKRGYPNHRKTFGRDLDEMASRNEIIKEVLVGGSQGTTTFISVK